VQLSKDGLLSVSSSNKKSKKNKAAAFTVHSAVRFPRSLTSYQRMQIHAVSEELGIQHRSCGEGSERFVEVSKDPFAPEVLPSIAAIDNPTPIISDEVHELHESDINTTQIHPDAVEVPLAVCEEGIKSSYLEPNQVDEVSTESVETETASISSLDVDSVAMESNGRLLRELHLSRVAEKTASAAALTGRINAAIHAKKTVKKVPSSSIPLGNKVDMTEDELLDAMIAEKKKLAQLNQYRLPSKPLLNPEKEDNKKKLHNLLAEARSSRLPATKMTSEESTSNAVPSASSSSSSHRKKVLKKPVPNFGGGVLGRK